jgi:hypothetical protein
MTMMTVRDFQVFPCSRSEIQHFIETHHYSKSINGCISDFCFKLVNDGKIIGAMFFGRLAMANAWKKYASRECDVTELRRLCCIDDTPKNTESFFIGSALRWLRKNTQIKIVVTYADSEYGHTGIIYKASNFKYAGFVKGARVILHEGKKYHDKAIRTKYKGDLKPFAKRLFEALKTGAASYVKTSGKHRYTYQFEKTL